MAITAYSQVRVGSTTTVTVTSDLTGVIYYHWYVDGAYVGMTLLPTRTFQLEPGEQVRIEANDTNDVDYDPVANAPHGAPARRSLWFVRSVDDDVAEYNIEQQQDGGAFTQIATVPHDDQRWAYSVLTDRLDDLSDYGWRAIAVDDAGNEGSALTLGSETVVRTPDAPDFAISFDSGTSRVTFSSA